MSIEHAVISFGSPRSGTTVMRRALAEIKGAFVTKIPEQAHNHPCHSGAFSWGPPESARTGLVGLSRMLQKEKLVFVRTVRHPMEIVRSLRAARHPDLREKTRSLAENTDEEIVEWVRSESENFHAQVGWILSNPYDHGLLVVKYENLARGKGQRRFARDLSSYLPDPDSNESRVFNWIHENWKTNPVRPGRLSHDVDADLSEDEERWFREQLAETIEREGYE